MPATVTRPQTFSIEHRGQRWSGEYSVDDAGTLSVGSAYGWDSQKLGRYQAHSMAERMLKDQVDAWRAKR